MSVVAAVTLPDGAILAADSRVRVERPDRQEEPPLHTDKIETVKGRVCAARFGIEESAAAAIAEIRERFDELTTPQAIMDAQDAAVRAQMAALSRRSEDFNPDHLGVGVVTAGLRGRVPFLAASVHHTAGIVGPILEERGGAAWLFGSGVTPEVRDNFGGLCNRVWDVCRWEQDQGPMNCRIRLLVDAIREAFEQATRNEPKLTGGNYTMRIIREGFGGEAGGADD